MHRGYIKHWRKEIDSDVWKMGIMYHRVWTWLKLKAAWKEEKFPTRQGHVILKPGQILCSIQGICDGCSYFDYGKEKKPNKKTVQDILDWMSSESVEMITKESNAKGTLITIVNWPIYNGASDEESNGEHTADKPLKKPAKKEKIKTEFRELTYEVMEMFYTQLPSSFKTDEFKAAIQDFTNGRMKKKAIWTERSIKRFCNLLINYSQNDVKKAIEIIDRSANAGWSDIYKPKESGYVKTKNTEGHRELKELF